MKFVPNGASMKEYAVKRFLHCRWNARIGKHQYLADWEGYGEEDRSFTEHIDNCDKLTADYYCLQFKKRVMEHAENRMKLLTHQRMIPLYKMKPQDCNSTFGDDELSSVK